MKKRVSVLILPIISLFLEILPFGAVLNFMSPSVDGTEIIRIREVYSYFSLTPFGYANFGPFLTALLTCASLILLLIFFFSNKHVFVNIGMVFIGIAVFASITPLFFGVHYASVIGVAITLTLIAEFFITFKLRSC